MRIRLVETGLGRFRAGNTELYIVIKHHAEERLAERLPLLDLQDVKEALEAGLEGFVDETTGKIELGQYLLINEVSGLMIPLEVAHNRTPGYENQVIGIVTTVMDYGARYQYQNDILDKYKHSIIVYLGEEDGEELLVESTNIPFGYTINGKPCILILLK